jgi:benzoyl-CoA reductase/2-hydroxyglutaryl-CoA dehydratase subunit BcrC/BadD/HgdB
MSMALETLDKLRKALRERPAELEAAKKDGKKIVGWIGYNVPEEIIHALDMIPVRLGIGGNDGLSELGANFISTQNCVFLRECVGMFAKNEDPYIRNADAVVVDATCLQMYRMSSVIKYYFKVNTLVLGVPRNYYLSDGKEYFRKEVACLAARLEELADTRLDAHKLADSIKLYDNINRAVIRLYRFPSLYCEPITWREIFEVVQAGYYLDREKYHGLLNELLLELKNRFGSSHQLCPENSTRVLLIGSAIHPGDRKLIDIIEQSGGKVVCDNLWSGMAPYLGRSVGEATVNGIADAYLDRSQHPALPYFGDEADARIKNIKSLIDEHNANGVIYYSLRFCDPVNFKLRSIKNALQKDGIPLLNIHTEYSGSDTEGIRTRVEAFVEMIDSKSAREKNL